MPRRTLTAVRRKLQKPWEAPPEEAPAGDVVIAEIDAWIGNRVRLRRVELRMQRVTVAAQMNISSQMYDRFEAGTSRLLPGRLWDLAGILEVSPGYFFEDFGEGERKETASQIASVITQSSLHAVLALNALSRANQAVIRRMISALLAEQGSKLVLGGADA